MNFNKRSIPSSKSPGITKKKRITMTNNIPTVSNDNNIRDPTGQNQKLPSLDDIAFFDKVVSFRKKKTTFFQFIFFRYKKLFVVHWYSIISYVVYFYIQKKSYLVLNYLNSFNPILGKTYSSKPERLISSFLLVMYRNY
jgi:hypothetical protein